MKTFARNTYGDIYLDSTGQIAMCTGKECHAQIIEAVILTLKGEIQLNTELGIPYLTTVFESKRFVKDWAMAVRKAITAFDWVYSIESFTYEFEGTKLLYNLEVQTIEDGQTETITVSNEIDTDIRIPVYVDPNGGGGDMGQNLIDSNGLFYLPVGKVDGVQRYRQMIQLEDPDTGVTTQLSKAEYVTDENGNFVLAE